MKDDIDETNSPIDGEPLLKNENNKLNPKFIILIIVINVLIFGALTVILLLVILKDEPSKEDSWEISYRKARNFVSKLNLTEKINLLFGTENMMGDTKLVNETEKRHYCVGRIDPFKNDKVDFKGMCLQDGPAGIRFAKGTSISWQAAINTACTFNKQLMYDVGRNQGQECKKKGINTLLAPCVNMQRSPQGGRVWESFGDDPFYSGSCATELIKGIQGEGVIASLKHFVGNDQETYRKASSSNMDMATLMDIYVEPFYRAIHYGNLGSILASYNAINNTYCVESNFILTQVLRNISGFKGFVMSNWWGVYSNHSNTINSGLDMNMPGGYNVNPDKEGHEYDNIGRNHSFWSNLEEYVADKSVTEERITEAATRIIATMYEMNQMENFPEVDLYIDTVDETRKRIQRKAATESQVLLKNEDNILPLGNKNISKIAIIGSDAFEQDCKNSKDCSCKNSTNEVFNGHIPLGYGSGTTDFSYLITPAQAIKELAEKYKIEIKESGKLSYKDEKRGDVDVHVSATEDIEGGVNVAKDSDIAIIFVSCISGEEYINTENTIGDRPNLDVLHNGNELIEAIAEVNKNIIVVINAPSVVNIPWKDKVKAIIFSGYPGAESGHAIADILFGEVYPSGHLPFVWAKPEDYPVKIDHLNNLTVIDKETGKTWKDEYRYDGIDSAGLPDDREGHEKEQYNYTEGLYIGQRWFNKNGVKPIYPFGFGLTYATFEYSELEVTMNKIGLKAVFKIKNNSKKVGQAVPMMFLTFPDDIGDYPKHIFKGFEKIEILPDSTQTVSILADEHALSYFKVEDNKYVRVNKGKIKVCIAENGDPSNVLLTKEIDANY